MVFALLAAPAHGAELQKHTIDAFERYVRATEARMDAENREDGRFLWIDRQPEGERQTLHSQLRRGDVIIEPLETREAGREIACPDGMLHHWIAMTFVPGVSLHQVLALTQDYGRYPDIYVPDVQRSRILSRNGDDFRVYLRLYKKTLVTVVLDTDNDVRFVRLNSRRAYSRSYATRIVQVENAGTADERQSPVGNDSGYLWRLNSYWRYEERDGGVYLEAETVGLTRDIPFVFRWLVRPLVSRLPRESLRYLLVATRRALARDTRTARQDSPDARRRSPESGTY